VPRRLPVAAPDDPLEEERADEPREGGRKADRPLLGAEDTDHHREDSGKEDRRPGRRAERPVREGHRLRQPPLDEVSRAQDPRPLVGAEEVRPPEEDETQQGASQEGQREEEPPRRFGILGPSALCRHGARVYGRPRAGHTSPP